jgi:plastocyanin domain-containing protein
MVRPAAPEEIVMTPKRFAALLLLVLPVAALLTSTARADQVSQASARTQVVRLTVDDKGAYVVTPSTVVKGVPVKMDVDMNSVRGCSRTVVIDAFNVKQTVKEGATTIEFTPSRTGKIEVVCGMKMTKGAFTVNDPK